MPKEKNQKKPLITTIWLRPTPTENRSRGIRLESRETTLASDSPAAEVTLYVRSAVKKSPTVSVQTSPASGSPAKLTTAWLKNVETDGWIGFGAPTATAA